MHFFWHVCERRLVGLYSYCLVFSVLSLYFCDFSFLARNRNSLHTCIVHIVALLVLFLHAVVNIKIIYGAQYKMYSS